MALDIGLLPIMHTFVIEFWYYWSESPKFGDNPLDILPDQLWYSTLYIITRTPVIRILP